ncbi:S41 family peptidase [Aquimarina gracilis]|uniref:S41 family peptidase n=1 Tax=Aquimarina gracilis TaxID=874422 RepID=A0ABU5ZV33_9FLAO|nr:S41 family peptidase [Aquimarina gracilis]MEB3345681.1 S41 family peptidase [Aquimarina gracilis]
MKRTIFILCFLIISNALNGQKQLDSLAALKDFEIFENILKKGHPSLYEYTNEDSLHYSFESTKEKIVKNTTDIDLYKKMLEITDKVKDGHLLLFAPNTVKTNQYYFPLILKIINTHFYTDTDDFGIPIGSKINAINERKASKILADLKKYTPSDGHNLTKKYRDIELKFGAFYAYEYGITKEFIVDYTSPEGITKSVTLDAESFVTVKLRNTKRNSYFAKFHKQENGFDFFKSYINNKEPFIYYKDNLSTAILVVNSFGIDIRAFKSKLITVFKELKEKETKHLIIDLRNNDGGFRPNGVHLYSFIAKKPFKQISSQYVSAIEVPEKEYVTRTFLNEKDFLTDKFKNHPVYDGWKLIFDDLEALMVPEKRRFKGKVYVLTSGTTFSAASSFCQSAKNENITLMGEETGGGYYISTGQFPVYYELPNSKIVMVMSMVRVENYVKDKTVKKGSGTPPDKYINLSVDNLVEGKDPLLDYLFRLIKG